MRSDCILDFDANLLVCHMVFVGNAQKSSIASHLTGLGPSFEFCSQGSAPTGIKVDKMSFRISLTLEASEMFLSLHMIFNLERVAVVRAILERTSSLR